VSDLPHVKVLLGPPGQVLSARMTFQIHTLAQKKVGDDTLQPCPKEAKPTIVIYLTEFDRVSVLSSIDELSK
jgi:hypothetical protein